MRILIAGGGGHIGSYLYAAFKNEFSLTTIDFAPSKDQKNSHILDLTKVGRVKTFADKHERFDVLIFLVGLAHEKGKGEDLPIFTKVNYQTLVNLLSSLDSSGKLPEKIIFSSTISVYGERLSQEVYSEDSSTDPASPYALTKLEAEKYLISNFGNRTWIMRFSPVYSQTFRLNIERRTRIGKWFYVVGKGSAKLSLCNIENISTAIRGIVNNSVPTGIYNISDSNDYSYNDLLNSMAGIKPLRIPRILVLLSYVLGKVSGNLFLKENSVKLLSDNIFSAAKIRTHVTLGATLEDVKYQK